MGVLDEVFPVIETAIKSLYNEPSEFVTHKQIVQFLQEDPESRRVVEAEYRNSAQELSFDRYAGNMLDWFSEKWTVGDDRWSELFRKFEGSKEKIDGCWAYKPTTASAVVVPTSLS